MKNISKVKEEFEQKVAELVKEVEPAHYVQNLNEIVLYGKMLELQEQFEKIANNLDKK